MDISTIAVGVTLGIIFYKVISIIAKWCLALLVIMWQKNRFMKILAILLGGVLLIIALALIIGVMNGFE